MLVYAQKVSPRECYYHKGKPFYTLEVGRMSVLDVEPDRLHGFKAFINLPSLLIADKSNKFVVLFFGSMMNDKEKTVPL